jgi:fatty acid desaturase
MWLGGWPGALLYNLMTRVGNTAAFFVFSWVVHHPGHYQIRPPRFPAKVGAAWALLFGRENLRGIRFHYLHHCFPHVPDRDLPALSHEMVELDAR